MANTQYQQLYKAIQSGARGGTIDDVVGAVVDGLTGALGSDAVSGTGKALESISSGIAPVGFAIGTIYNVYKLVKSKKDCAESPNPHFVLNGKADPDDPESPVTLKYIRGRLGKNIAGGAIALGGSISSKFMADVDVVGALQHANATGSTIAHIMKLKSIAQSYKQSETITRWIDTVLMMKMQKATIRGASIVGSLVPGAGLPIGIATTIVKIGIKLTLSKICYWTAADLHWRAHREKVISRGGVGPAGRILTEIFTRRGATRIFGKYDVEAMIKEPCGWLAVADKILLI